VVRSHRTLCSTFLAALSAATAALAPLTIARADHDDWKKDIRDAAARVQRYDDRRYGNDKEREKYQRKQDKEWDKLQREREKDGEKRQRERDRDWQDARRRDDWRYGGSRDNRDDWRYRNDEQRRRQEEDARREIDRRQDSKNQWRNLGYASAAAALYGVLRNDKTVMFAGAAGALYSAHRYEQDRKSQDMASRARAALFDQGWYERDGVRYTRRDTWRDGQRYYYFCR
jgi:hypothetical protein